ncbi:Glycoside hydrolase family 22 [Trinorchestia longiramus]|nr:Glycoside hydrolase family 22 [Trinorchestia longiramus]
MAADMIVLSYIQMRLTISIFLLVGALLAATSHARVFTKCQLAKKLKCTYKIPKNKLADWVCLVKAESNYNTAVVNTNNDGSKDYGLFQISNKVWCGSGTGTNECNIPCKKLKNNKIADDVKCAKKIYASQGFYAWSGWKKTCKDKDLSSFISGCSLKC